MKGLVSACYEISMVTHWWQVVVTEVCVMCWVFTLMLLRKLPREKHVGGNKLTTN